MEQAWNLLQSLMYHPNWSGTCITHNRLVAPRMHWSNHSDLMSLEDCAIGGICYQDCQAAVLAGVPAKKGKKALLTGFPRNIRTLAHTCLCDDRFESDRVERLPSGLIGWLWQKYWVLETTQIWLGSNECDCLKLD